MKNDHNVSRPYNCDQCDYAGKKKILLKFEMYKYEM